MLISNENFRNRARRASQDFTRDRKLGFQTLFYLLLSMINEASQIAVKRFFAKIKNRITVKQQSFSEARQKIKWEAFQELFAAMTEIIYSGWFELWHGYRLLAIDGTKVALPDDEKLRKYFGTDGRGSTSVTGQGSILYDVLNRIIIDAQLEPMGRDERSLATRHILRLMGMKSFRRELIILDRGYASRELIQMLEKAGITYVMRVKRGFNKNIDKLPGSCKKVTIVSAEQGTIDVRVVKFKLSSGETETLITNLRGKRYNEAAFKELYFMRWPVETKYNELKNKMEIENFSGRTETAVKQDFYATMYLSNIAAVFYWEAQEKVIEERQDKENKYEYHVNVNHEIGVLKDELVKVFLETDEKERNNLLENIINEIKDCVTPYRHGRSVPRNPCPRKVKFHHNQKSNC